MKNIFLVGMPSSGKSTVGRELATLLSYQYIDLDEVIATKVGKSIPAIFAEEGEDFFRVQESQLLQEVAPDQGLIVGTGGGAPCFFDNMDFIKQNGISVFLDVPVEELVQRLQQHGVEDRPLLAQMTQLKEELQAKLNWRRAYYEQADVVVQGSTNAAAVHDSLRLLL